MVFLEGNRCYLRTLEEADVSAFTRLVKRNKRYWSIYEPLHDDEYYTESTQRKKIIESVQRMRLNREYSFAIFAMGTSDLVGHISIYSIKRLPFSSAFVGYSIDKRYIGQGIASEALALIVKFSFEDLSMHRIEAYVSPNNMGSVRVLEKSGFEREGLLRKLLYINGYWEDHYLYAFINDDY
ncbi:GNAT family N-acetyltransferase [Viridibacillus sp. YIM B01967]|uniref:GNAT family N-acetyltransferase n=1 Tax=Viridibacillus soli TaxID=2798301 RepID=A0ABS1H9S7_9BACL|nr:GNAT family protein [Viridibacillus soli]MBK3495783.1 GNAT family N-acetyltransferase [Viridibacillus soli]